MKHRYGAGGDPSMKRMGLVIVVLAILIPAWTAAYAQAGLTSALTPQAQISGTDELLRDTILSVMENAATAFSMDIDTKNLVLVSQGDVILIGVAACSFESSTVTAATSGQQADVGLVYVSHPSTAWAGRDTTDPNVAPSSEVEDGLPAGFYALRLALDGTAAEMRVVDALGRIVVRLPVSPGPATDSPEVSGSLQSLSDADETMGCLSWYGPRLSIEVCMMFSS